MQGIRLSAEKVLAVLASPDPWGGIDVVLAITEKEAAEEALDAGFDKDSPFSASS